MVVSCRARSPYGPSASAFRTWPLAAGCIDTVGRLLTDETLTRVNDERILVAGDSAALSGLPLRMSCLNAAPLAARAADTVLSRLAGEQPDNAHPSFYAQCISLGLPGGVARRRHLLRAHCVETPAAADRAA